MERWTDFRSAAREIAGAGLRKLGGEVGILATVTAYGAPRIAPVSPILCDDGIYLSVGAHTPKCGDLTRHGGYALHSMVGADDEEFQISGQVRLVNDADERARVHAAIPFPTFDPNDPIFELLIERALWVTWSGPGKGQVKRSWSARSRSG